ncbi:dynein regulatory complex subunit 5-like [Halichondria panicea]|uniref:dynein regulatory complex subunit 5-like n=1 Tax=Halichondria panicea TaxID=6063 RepID=UPI00312B3135
MDKAKNRNPAADLRKMRRIIAEDPEWNLEIVPPLVDVCISHIVGNFGENPLFEELLPKHKQNVLKKLSPNIPLKITAPLINDESYWERCCRGRWELCDLSEYSGQWKRMFFERNAQETVETFVPEQSDIFKLEGTLQLSSQYVHRLRVNQLLPPPRDKAINGDDDDGLTEDGTLSVCNDHLNCGLILKNLHQLDELSLTFGVKNCGMNFDWSLFEFTARDSQLLANGLKATPTLRVFRLNRSKVGDQKGRLIISHLLDHPSLSVLDLSHNKLGDNAGRAIGKLLNGHSPKLVTVELSNNLIGKQGGVSIGHALHNNGIVRELNLRMNRLGDEGTQSILKALQGKNDSLLTLNIGSNDMGEASAQALSEMVIINKTLQNLNITCNKILEAGGKLIQHGMEENKSLLNFDLRLTEISQESEYCINQAVKDNQDRGGTR